MLAIAQGIDLLEIGERTQSDQEQVSAEQVSYEQVRQTRAVEVRHLELREQALQQGLEQLASEQRKLVEELAHRQRVRETFQRELLSFQQGAVATGRENARLKLEALKPQQAKAQLVEMLKNDELDEVVAILADMPDTKAAKIMAQFTLPNENEQLYEILKRIREGYPDSQLAVDTQSQLGQAGRIDI